MITPIKIYNAFTYTENPCFAYRKTGIFDSLKPAVINRLILYLVNAISSAEGILHLTAADSQRLHTAQ